MSIILDSDYAHTPQTAPPTLPPAVPLLRQVPALLEYRGEADPDVEFIPKTVAGFALGAMAMGVSLDLCEALFLHHDPGMLIPAGMLTRFAVMLGLTAVATSLLLVGLKVRAERSPVPLFARHWLNSLGTGALYALMVWGPWVLMTHQFFINRYVAASIWMALMAFPALAAKWTIGPHPSASRH